METVEVVIKIQKDLYETLKANIVGTLPKDSQLASIFTALISLGTVLPKGHGRLIDAEKIAREVNRAWTLWEKKGEDCYLFSDVFTPMLVSQQTIIEADKEVEE